MNRGNKYYHLLTKGAWSPKLAHGQEELNVLSAILYLAPANNLEGINVCAAASPFCRELCLYRSGRMEFDTSGRIEAARKRRTALFRDNQAMFMALLVDDLEKLQRVAGRHGVQPVARLNGTSDILWEHIPCTRKGIDYASVMQAFPDILFYDYTKIPARITAHRQGRLPANYYVIFSLSESNDRLALRALEAGMNVAVPMHIRKHQPPAEWSGFPVVDGDKHDYRFADPQGGYIVALSPKGRAAKKDHSSGFIREVTDVLDASKAITFASA